MTNEAQRRYAKVAVHGALVALGIACVAFPPLGFVVLCMWLYDRKLKREAKR